jgi:hypothetical protein
MLVWVLDVLRRDRFVAGPTWSVAAEESQR